MATISREILEYNSSQTAENTCIGRKRYPAFLKDFGSLKGL